MRFGELLKDIDKQQSLSEHIKKLELPKATKDIADEVEKLIGK